MRIEKRPLVSERIRQIPRTGFSWIDRQFLRKHATGLNHDAIYLYFFLSAVSDKHGVSYYGDSGIAACLRMKEVAVVCARDELVSHDLIAHEPPLYQVLSLPDPVPRSGGDGLTVIGDIFRQLAEGSARNTPRRGPTP